MARILVIGASRGIGLAIAKPVPTDGAHTPLVAHNSDPPPPPPRPPQGSRCRTRAAPRC